MTLNNCQEQRSMLWGVNTHSSLAEVICVVERLGGGSDYGFSKLTSTENKTTWANDAHLSVSSTDHVYSMPCSKKSSNFQLQLHSIHGSTALHKHFFSVTSSTETILCMYYVWHAIVYGKEHKARMLTTCQCAKYVPWKVVCCILHTYICPL